MKLARTLPLAFLLLSVPLLAPAQAQNKGIISGRVVAEDGGGLPGITVRLTPTGTTRFSAARTTSTDDEGNFRFADLPPRVFSIRAEGGRAYVPAPQSPADRAQPRYVRTGESITLNMIRGGVITGRVTNGDNQVMIALPLAAIQVRDGEGNLVIGQSVSPATRAYTDDRGIYRFWGLPPGTYVVLANTGNPYFGSQASLYDNEAPTYYPSSTRDTAAEVQVAGGAEISGIDIRFRGERGHAISGKLTSSTATINVSLLQVSTGALLATSFAYRGAGDPVFDFYGVPDGEYELVANTDSQASDPMASQLRRVSVRGVDVTGIELRLLPLGSIAGRIAIEASPATCVNSPKTRLEEIVLSARLEEKPKGEAEPVFKPGSSEGPANDKGEFTITRLHALRYRLAANLPNETLHVKSIAVKPATAAKSAVTAADLARQGIPLKQGEKLTDVTVTLSEGAASLRGKVLAEKPGGQLPSRMRVQLIPAEPASADDVLRYAETLARYDGTFAMTNLSPGKYWLLTRAVPEEEPVDRPPAPAAWDATERAKLRKLAEAAKQEIELKACQRVKDHLLRF
jgi:hypothetical protein